MVDGAHTCFNTIVETCFARQKSYRSAVFIEL